MTRRSISTWLSLIVLWSFGLFLAIGSKSYDPDEEEPVDPVLVDFTVSGSGDMTLENGDTTDTVSGLTLSGGFEKGGNDSITIRDVPVDLDTTTEFNLSIIPSEGDNLLTGTLSISVSDDLEFGVERSPATGQLMLDRNGSTTLITFSDDSNNVSVVVGANAPVSVTFDDLRTLFSDQDRDLDLRFASKSYRTLETLWLIGRISETVQQNLNSNLEMLQSMGRLETLNLDCDNLSGTPTPSYAMTWIVDAAGSGLFEAGNDDSFELAWTNCLFSGDSRYIGNGLRLSDYQLNNETTPRAMSFTAAFDSTLVSSEVLESTTPSLTVSRVDGTILVSASEGATVSTQN